MELGISQSAALTFAVALAAGMVAQAVARHLRIPGIVLLLAVGVLLGPEVAGVVVPDQLGAGRRVIVGMSVAVILFEGGLNLNIGRLREEALVLRRLVTLGALITGLGGTVAAHLLMGWGWHLAVIFGTLVIVTGPTVMTPLLRRIDVTPRVQTVLEGEGVLIDPIGAILAVVALEIVLTLHGPHAGTGAVELLGLPSRLVLGSVIGLGGGFLVGKLFQHPEVVPDGLENVLALSLVLVLYEFGETLQPESGVLAAAVAGIVVGNMGTHIERELQEFKEQLTVLLIGLLFVLLAATVRLEAVVSLGWGGVATIAALMFVVRPLGVAACSAGSDLDLEERLFVSWLAPRGIVAAAFAAFAAQSLEGAGIPGGAQLQALVFSVIAATVVIQGGTSRLVARVLGVRRDTDRGWGIVGADALARALGRALSVAGEEVVLIDSNALHCQEAEREGLPVVYGDATGERAYRQAQIGYRRGVAAVTPNPALNLLVMREFERRDHVDAGGVAVDVRSEEVTPATVENAGHEILFGGAVDLDDWRHAFEQGLVDITAWRWGGEGDTAPEGEPAATRGARPDLRPAGGEADLAVPAASGGPARDPEGQGESGAWLEELPRSVLPLVLQRDGQAEPVTEGGRLLPGDVVYFAWRYAEGSAAGEWLREAGWSAAVPVDGGG